jgi:hypothetical protein
MKRFSDMTEPELRSYLNEMASAITGITVGLGVEKPNFVLLIFNDPREAQYVSNCFRPDVIRALREGADRLEKTGHPSDMDPSQPG